MENQSTNGQIMTTPGAKLKLIRETLKQASPDWETLTNGTSEFVTAKDHNGQLTELCTITALNPADAQLLREAIFYPAFLLDLLDKSFAEVKRLKPFEPEQKPDKNYTTQCGMQCSRDDFKLFLREVHGMKGNSNDAAASKVRQLLDISSRKQLNTSWEKSRKWLKLNQEFNQFTIYLEHQTP